MSTLILYPLLTVAAYYLGSRAKVTQWLWSRYPKFVDEFMVCAACSGWWYGLGVGVLGRELELSYLGLSPHAWYTPAFVAFSSMVWTPILAWLHIAALDHLGGPTDEGTEDASQKEP